MGHGGGYGVVGPADGLAAAAVDNVRLSYHYLDAGDIEGYASLFHPNAVLRHPGHRPVCASEQPAVLARQHSRGGVHNIQQLFAAGNHVAAVGLLIGHESNRSTDFEFADIFTVSDHGLLTARVTYFFTSPK